MIDELMSTLQSISNHESQRRGRALERSEGYCRIRIRIQRGFLVVLDDV